MKKMRCKIKLEITCIKKKKPRVAETPFGLLEFTEYFLKFFSFELLLKIFIYLVALGLSCGIWDLNSLTRYGMGTPALAAQVLATGPRESLEFTEFNKHLNSKKTAQ